MCGGIQADRSVHHPPHYELGVMTINNLFDHPAWSPTLAPAGRQSQALVLLDRRKHRPARAIPWGMGESPSRRALNLAVAALGLLAAAPVMAFTALAIALTSRRPVLYTQVRIGLDRRKSRCEDGHPRRRHDLGGRPFEMYKFRTMDVDAERLTGAVWARPNDPRVTRLGRFLRRYRFDELPQFLNVLKGDMNVVGPRPERPAIFAQLRQAIREYPLRQRARPGITGLAQVNQHYDTSMEDVRRKLRFDLDYIWTQGVVTDLRILLLSAPAVLFRCRGW